MLALEILAAGITVKVETEIAEYISDES